MLSDGEKIVVRDIISYVSMHLLVLSAFRPHDLAREKTSRFSRLNAPFGAQCFPTRSFWRYFPDCSVSMHLLVLSAFRPTLTADREHLEHRLSQCTFWCSVLSDSRTRPDKPGTRRLNAPFGAQCFPTWNFLFFDLMSAFRLNAPFGAQCFPTVCAASHAYW